MPLKSAYTRDVSAPAGLETELGSGPARPMANWRVPSQIAELVEHSPLETIYLRGFAWLFIVSGIGYYFLVARNWDLPEPALAAHIQVFGMIGIAEICLVFLYTRLSNKIDLGPGLRRLQTKVPAEHACPVHIDVVQESVVTGSDEGFLWVDEGTLYFKGLQTVFRLNSSDVPPLGMWPRKLRPSIDKGKPPRILLVPVADKVVKIKIDLIDPFEDRGARRRTANFDRTLTKWLAERPTGHLESLLPPLQLHDALRRTGPFRLEGLMAGVIVTLVNLTILFTARRDYSSNDLMSVTNGLEFTAGVLLCALSLRMAFGQWRDLQVRHQLSLKLPDSF